MNQEPETSSEEENGSPNEAAELAGKKEPATQGGKPPKRPDPTRYGDWEKDGRCIDF
jgi:hypothetical protein